TDDGDGPEEVDVDDPPPVGRVDLEDRPARVGPRGRDDRRRRPDLLDERGDRRRRRVPVAEVGDDVRDVPGGCDPVDDGRAPARRGDRRDDGGAEAARPSGDVDRPYLAYVVHLAPPVARACSAAWAAGSERWMIEVVDRRPR